MASPEATPGKTVYVVSDATGTTATRVVRAALAQFKYTRVALKIIPEVQTVEQIRQVIHKAKKRQALIAYTFVSPTLRTEITLLSNETNVPIVDLIGPLLNTLIGFLTVKPAYQAGLFTEPSDEQYQRLEAITFTVQHDDGQRRHGLKEADVVIVGPSRTSKTPLSVYLAHTRGLKVANVPLVLGVEPFEELDTLDERQVVALTIKPTLLASIRQVRQQQLGASQIQYAGGDHIQRELRYCHELYRRHPSWSVIDVTGRSIEEIAANVCALTVDGRPKRRIG